MLKYLTTWENRKNIYVGLKKLTKLTCIKLSQFYNDIAYSKWLFRDTKHWKVCLKFKEFVSVNKSINNFCDVDNMVDYTFFKSDYIVHLNSMHWRRYKLHLNRKITKKTECIVNIEKFQELKSIIRRHVWPFLKL